MIRRWMRWRRSVATSPAERQRVLSDLSTLGIRDLVEVWRKAALADTDFADLILAAFPEIASAYAGMAGDLAADWYVESAPEIQYTPIVGPVANIAALTSSTQWALGANGDEALKRMSGTLQRAVFNGARETTLVNVEHEEGAKWARHASANACVFCKLLATRDILYSSKQSAERVVGRGQDFSRNFTSDGKRKAGGQAKGVKTRGTQKVGDKYHDHCHCTAIEVRPGGQYEPPPYVADWKKVYKDAFDAVPNGTPYDDKNSVLKAVLANMRADPASQ